MSWFNDPIRHSLAARGIRSKYLYHGTIKGKLPLIKRSGGLKPDPKNRNYDDSEDFVYFTTTEFYAKDWAREIKDAKLEWRVRKKFKLPSHRWCLTHGKEYPEVDEKKVNRFRRSEQHDDLKGVILRVKKSDLMELNNLERDDMLWGDHKYEDTYTFDGLVPIDMIEIKTEEGWRPLK